MLRWILRATLLTALAVAPSALAKCAQVPEQVIHKAFHSVVLLVMQDANGRPVSLGSGFFVRRGIVATNLHVVRGAAGGYAKLIGQNGRYRVAGVVAVDMKQDLVLLSVKEASAPPLPLGNSQRMTVGQSVYVIGNPEGLEGTLSEGIISGVRHAGLGTLLQISAPISPGSSGGPVLDAHGAVIGVAAATVEGGQNLNFAVPSLYLVSLLGHMKAIRPLPVVADAGSPGSRPAMPPPPKPVPKSEWSLQHPHIVACARGTEDGKTYEEAEQECRMALQSGPSDLLTGIHYSYGTLLMSERKWNGAIAEFNACLRLSSGNDSSCHQGIAEALEGKGDVGGAIAEYRLAIRLAQYETSADQASGVPQSITDMLLANLHSRLGGALFQNDDLAGATAEFEEVVHLRPDDVDAHDILATVLALKGDHAAAIDQCRTAQELSPSGNSLSDFCKRVLGGLRK